MFESFLKCGHQEVPFFTVYTFDVSIFFDIKENACNVFPGSQRLLKIIVPQFWMMKKSLLKQSRLGEVTYIFNGRLAQTQGIRIGQSRSPTKNGQCFHSLAVLGHSSFGSPCHRLFLAFIQTVADLVADLTPPKKYWQFLATNHTWQILLRSTYWFAGVIALIVMVVW